MQVFARKGYHDTKIEDVAQAAGIGKGTVYEYFDSKLHLFQDIMNKSISEYYCRLNTEDYNAMTFEQRLMHILESHFSFCMDQKNLTRIMFWDTEYMDKELRDWAVSQRMEKEARLQALVEEAIERGEIRAVDPRVLTLTITGVTSALFVPIVLGEMDVVPHDAAGVFADIILNGINKR